MYAAVSFKCFQPSFDNIHFLFLVSLTQSFVISPFIILSMTFCLAADMLEKISYGCNIFGSPSTTIEICSPLSNSPPTPAIPTGRRPLFVIRTIMCGLSNLWLGRLPASANTPVIEFLIFPTSPNAVEKSIATLSIMRSLIIFHPSAPNAVKRASDETTSA